MFKNQLSLWPPLLPCSLPTCEHLTKESEAARPVSSAQARLPPLKVVSLLQQSKQECKDEHCNHCAKRSCNLVHLPHITIITNMRTVSFLLLGLASISGTLAQKSDETTIHVSGTGHVSLKAKARHVFVFFITPKYFNWSESQDEGNRQRTKDGGLLRFELN